MDREKFNKFMIKDLIHELPMIEFNSVLGFRNPIIFDTNFLFVTFQFNIDIISEIEKLIGSTFSLFIYEGTIDELSSVERKKDKNKKYLPLIFSLLKRYNFKIISSNQSYIDNQILENLNKNVIIATNDKKLKYEIQKQGYKIMYLRQRSYLEVN